MTASKRWQILVTMRRCIVLAVIFVASRAVADDSTRARELFAEGQDFAKQGKWQQACAKFSESNKLERAVGTELNLADCLVHVGKLAEAWRLFDEGAAELERVNKARAQVVRGRADDLAGKLATVTVKLAQPDVQLTLSIAGREVPTKPEVIERLDPGTVVVTASAPGREPFYTTVTVPAGGAIVIEVPALAMPPGDTPPPPEVGPRRRSRVYLAYGVGAAGALAIAGGIVMNLIAQSNYDDVIHSSDCLSTTPPQCYPAGLQKIADAQQLADIGTVTAIVGTVAVVTAGVVYFTAPRERVTVTPVANAHGVGLAIGGSF